MILNIFLKPKFRYTNILTSKQKGKDVMKTKIKSLILATTVLLSATSAQAADIRRAYCQDSPGVIEAVARGSWSDTNGNRFHVSVTSPTGAIEFEHDTSLFFLMDSDIIVTGVKISSPNSIMRLWDTDETFNKYYRCNGSKVTYSKTTTELSDKEQKKLLDKLKLLEQKKNSEN